MPRRSLAKHPPILVEEGPAEATRKRSKTEDWQTRIGRREAMPITAMKKILAKSEAPAVERGVVGLLAAGEAQSGGDAQVVAVSRLMAGRAICLSQIEGDVVLRVSPTHLAVDVLVPGGRRARFEASLDDVVECETSVADDPDREFECGTCGIRFGAVRHLESHAEFHDNPKCQTTISARARIAFKTDADLAWRREVNVDPTTVTAFDGARATYEPIPKYEDPLVDELQRTSVLTLRFRDVDPPSSLGPLVEASRKRAEEADVDAAPDDPEDNVEAD